ncbi:MAG: nicotinate (nicotinamide) nucleotide adenylyltransferase [Lagierella massiliensis]|nr:nicotinate (nicotinamide) nucleotide adenylyltransferase [Lagierella massiliensis]
MNCHNFGVFGGTFNPLHLGHLIIAQEVKEYLNLNKIIFIPSGNPPHKSLQVSREDRLKMVELGISDNENFLIEDYEIKKKSRSYSVETIAYLEKKYRCTGLYFIIGEDSFMEIEKWYKYKELISKVKLIVVNRNTKYAEKIENKILRYRHKGYDVDWIKIPYLDISSSYIREGFKSGKDPRYYLPDKVYEYITDRGLYD